MFEFFFGLLLTKSVFLVDFVSSVATYDEDEARRLVHFAGAVYCVDDEAFGTAYEDLIFDWECDACDYISDTSELTYIYPFQDSSFWLDTEGLITYDSLNNKITVVFAGTDPTEIIDIITDIELIRVDYPPCAADYWWQNGCTVHKGFYKAFLNVADDVYEHVLDLYNTYDSPEIEVTGHSLGGALAILCALDLTENHDVSLTPDYVYTFGSPRVGDAEFVDHYIDTLGSNKLIRVTHRKDPVPLVPWTDWGWNYLHIPGEVYYPDDSDGSYQICDGSGEDEDCINQYNWWDVLLNVFIISDHLAYLDVDFFTGVLECNTGLNFGGGNLPGNNSDSETSASTAVPKNITVNETFSDTINIVLNWTEYGSAMYTSDDISGSVGLQTLIIYALKEASVVVRYDLEDDGEIDCNIKNVTDVSGDSKVTSIKMEVSFETEKRLTGFFCDISYILSLFDSNLKSSLALSNETTLISEDYYVATGYSTTEEGANTDGCDCSKSTDTSDNLSDGNDSGWADLGVIIFLIVFGVLLVASLIIYTKRRAESAKKGGNGGNKELSSRDHLAQRKMDMKRVTSNGFNVQYVSDKGRT